jgi:UDP-N-acetylglucosamine:LPS N-acetylglucosamine transferase
LTGILLKALDQCPGSFYITALVGPLNENASGIKSVIARMRKEAELIIGAENVYPYFASADFALSAAGVTALELAALRVPALLFPQNRGERLNARSLQASGSALCYSDVLSISSIARTIEDLCQKPETLAKISRKAGKMFDGQGASRIISAIEEKLK